MHDKIRRWKNLHIALIPRQIVRKITLRRLAMRDFSTPGITYKIASSQHELTQAFDLLERSYVERGIACDGQVRLRISNRLRATTTFIALRDMRVVGTISLIEDSELGLPAEQVHCGDVCRVRNGHRNLAEAGGLAIARSERGSAVSILLFSMLFRWARNWPQVDDLLISIHPSTRHFYADVLLFRRIGRPKAYAELNGAASLLMALDVVDLQPRFHRLYTTQIIDRTANLSFYDLFFAPDDRFDFSRHPNG